MGLSCLAVICGGLLLLSLSTKGVWMQKNHTILKRFFAYFRLETYQKTVLSQSIFQTNPPFGHTLFRTNPLSDEASFGLTAPSARFLVMTYLSTQLDDAADPT